MILGLGEHPAGLARAGAQRDIELVQVLLDQVVAGGAHADHPSTDWIPQVKCRYSVRSAASAAAPGPVSAYTRRRLPSAMAHELLEQPGVLEPVQRRVDGALRQVEGALTAPAQLGNDRVPVRGPGGEHGQQEQVQVSLEAFPIHTSERYA